MRRLLRAGAVVTGLGVLTGCGAQAGKSPPSHPVAGARPHAGKVRAKVTLPPVPAPAALGLNPGAVKLVPGPEPLLVAWTTGFRLPWFLEVYLPRKGHWVLAYQKNVANQITAVEAGPPGPRGQESVLCLGWSQGVDAVGAFYNLVETGQQVRLAGEVSGVGPAFGPGYGEWFPDQHYAVRWQNGQLETFALGLSSTVPPGSVEASWHISAAGAVKGPAALFARPGQAVALLPDGPSRSRDPVLLGPFSGRAAAEAAIRAGFGAMAMYQQVHGFVINPAAGTSYWVMAEWVPGQPAPAAGAVVRITVP